MTRKRIKDLPGFERPREKLLERGPQALSDVELVAILLGMGSGVEGKSALDLAQAILERTGPDLPCCSVDDLCELAGVGVAKACRIAAAFELARRFSQRARPRIRKPEGALPYIQHIAGEKQEYFLCLILNGAGVTLTTTPRGSWNPHPRTSRSPGGGGDEPGDRGPGLPHRVQARVCLAQGPWPYVSSS